jgi:hypothetical protein
VDPKVVACSFIASGLRIFNIADIVHPKEIGYFVAPPQPRSENQYKASDFAMSKPAFAPERHEIWFTDGTSGFYALKLTNDVWPAAAGGGGNGGGVLGTCKSSTRKTYTLRLRGVRSVRASLGKKRVRVLKVKRGKRFARVTVSTAGLHNGKLRFRVKLKSGRTVKRTRTFKGCAAH